MLSGSLENLNTKTKGREVFITKAYQHLLAAVAFFAAVEYYLFSSGIAINIAQALTGVSWLMVLGAFMIVGWFASRTAARAESKTAQYAALFGFALAEAIIFVPLIYYAEMRAPGVLKSAGIVTAVGFAGLSAIAFQTRKDFSFMAGFLRWGGFIAIGLIIASVLGVMNLGAWFSVAMIGFAGAAILYDTSNIIHHYPEEKYVSAGLELFSSIMLMLWYVIQFMGGLAGGD